MSAEVEVYLSNMRGGAVTVGKRTHVLLQTRRSPSWAQAFQPAPGAPTLGDGLLGLFEHAGQRNGEP